MSNRNRVRNLAVIRKGINATLPAIEQRRVISIFTNVSAAVFEWIDSHAGYYQDQTYNLRDSIGVGVYRKGVLVKWIQTPSPKAIRGKRFSPGADSPYYYTIHGRDLLINATQNATSHNLALYALVVFAAAPYGIMVEDGDGKRGTGWWSEGLVPYVRQRFIDEIAKYK